MIICGYCKKNLPIFYANWNAAGKCSRIYGINGYGSGLFLTVGKPDIYQNKSSGKSATVFIHVFESL
jgi:hypothetical protein